jgi:MFS family permease
MSMIQITNGFFDSFSLFVLMRFVYGGICSAMDPLIYQVMVDNVPKEHRAMGNAFMSSATFAGLAVSSLTILCIKSLGWRGTYYAIAALGLLGSLMNLIFIKDKPKENKI